ncbi:hypothetical protein K3179_04900 [Qipengyuania sp. GH38]|uniref:hypothetical protein n=1 Tax=Qipengyuania intermedia TaxID=2867244 RepID=UPI001C87A851|nr:hypothetical protein [Qipengyuania intermedia]MBX7513884.1 hypothetical protein [Qipengyuania intermedia]
MFEGHINRKAFVEGRESEVLQRFRWTELVARLEATRELRAELAKGSVGGFEAFGEVRRENCENGKSAINHTDLVHGKVAGLNPSRAANGAVHGDKEK